MREPVLNNERSEKSKVGGGGGGSDRIKIERKNV